MSLQSGKKGILNFINKPKYVILKLLQKTTQQKKTFSDSEHNILKITSEN